MVVPLNTTGGGRGREEEEEGRRGCKEEGSREMDVGLRKKCKDEE